MVGKQAKVFSPKELRQLMMAASTGRFPERDRLIVLLAARAGLRACEIANLTWGMVLDASGNVAPLIEVRGSIAKRGSGRRVPMHVQLRRALRAWKSNLSTPEEVCSSGSARALNGVHLTPAAPPIPTIVGEARYRRRDRPETDRHAAAQQIFEKGQLRRFPITRAGPCGPAACG